LKRNTQELLEILKSTPKIENYLSNFPEVKEKEPLPSSLKALLMKKNVKKSQCIQDSGLDRNYAYQIFSGGRTPSRDKLLALCLAMHLTIEEVHTLFCSTEYPDLYPKNQRDSVIIFALQKQLSVSDTNNLLYELNMELLDL